MPSKKSQKSEKPERTGKSRKQIMKEEQELRLKQKLDEEEKEKQYKIERDRLKNLAKLAKEKEKTELFEHEKRKETLMISCEEFRAIKKDKLGRDIALREQENWEHYLKCDGKPNPDDMNDMNYYLYSWKNDDKSGELEAFLAKSDEIFEILDLFEEFIRNPLDEPNYKVALWKEMRQRFLDELSLKIDNATYGVIHDVEKNMTSINKYSAILVHDKPTFAIGLWAKKQTADVCTSPENTEPLFPVAELPQVFVSVNIPYQLTFQFYVVRVNRFKYDSYSDASRTSKAKLMPDELSKDLYQYSSDEYELKIRLKAEYEEELRIRKERKKKRWRRQQERLSKSRKGSKITEDANAAQPITADSSLLGGSFDGGSMIMGSESAESSRSSNRSSSFNIPDSQGDTGPLKLPSEIMLQTELADMKYLKRYLEVHVEPDSDELNLRQYMTLGGVYHIDFLEALPQPVILPDRSVLRLTYGESVIKFITFDWKNNRIQRKSLRKLKDYFDELSKYLDLDKVDQRGSLRDLFMGGEARLSKYYIPGELRASMMLVKEKTKKKKVKSDVTKENEEQTKEEEEVNVEEKPKKKKRSTGIDLEDEIDLNEESSSEEDEDNVEENLSRVLNESGEEEIEDDGQEEDAFDERRRYEEEISILEFDEINFKPEIFITLNEEVYWFETPFPVTWNLEKKYWSKSEGMQNIKFDEKKKEISFRMEAHRKPIALAVSRYLNLPLIKWELIPVFNDSGKVDRIHFSLSTIRFTVNLSIKSQKVRIESIENLNSNTERIANGGKEDSKNSEPHPEADKKLYGKYYKPDKLVRSLESIGLDIFPDHDAYLYLPAVMPKHWICEDHLNMCVALACTTHEFKSSKWNKSAGSKKILFYLRERFLQNVNTKFKLTLVTPERAVDIQCDDNASEYEETIAKGHAFYPDLYWLIQDNSCTMTKLNMKNIDMGVVDTVYELLSRTRVFSYS